MAQVCQKMAVHDFSMNLDPPPYHFLDFASLTDPCHLLVSTGRLYLEENFYDLQVNAYAQEEDCGLAENLCVQ